MLAEVGCVVEASPLFVIVCCLLSTANLFVFSGISQYLNETVICLRLQDY